MVTNRNWGSTNLAYTFNQAFYGILDGKDLIFDADGHIVNTDTEEHEKYPFEIEAPFHSVIDNRLTSFSTFLTGKSKFELALGYQNNRRSENEALDSVKKGYKYVDMTLQTITYNTKWYAPKWNLFNTKIGLQGMIQNNKNNDGAATIIIPNANINDIGIYALSKFDYPILISALVDAMIRGS